MATKEEAQAVYDELRVALRIGRRKAMKVLAIADATDRLIERIMADDDLKAKVQACIDAGPESLTGLKADVKAIRDIATLTAVKFPPEPDPVVEPVE